MVKLILIAAASFLGSAAAFQAPAQASARTPSLLKATDYWDPLELSVLGENFDTFGNMFPHQDFVTEAEIKHGRMSMLAWTGIWATHEGGFGLGLHIPGYPVCDDWTKALGVFASERPTDFAAILGLIAIAEGESVGHSGDNFRGMGSKIPGNNGLDIFGLKKKLSAEEQARYGAVERTQGRAAMIAMASMFAFESIPGSVPLMDLFGAK